MFDIFSYIDKTLFYYIMYSSIHIYIKEKKCKMFFLRRRKKCNVKEQHLHKVFLRKIHSEISRPLNVNIANIYFRIFYIFDK